MYIDKLQIDSWRNFQELAVPVPQGAGLVCLVGDNGTGKSNILELIAALSHRFGLAPGVETARGNALNEPHAVSARLQLTEDFADPLIALADTPFQEAAQDWDRSLGLRSTRSEAGNHSVTIRAGGLEGAAAESLARQAVEILRRQKTVHHVHLDADRAHTATALDQRKLLSALSTDWSQPQQLRNRSFRPTKTLFEDWLQYLVGAEAAAADEFMRISRLAKETGEKQPEFEEPFKDYKQALREVLPHLRFRRIDRQKRTVIFDSAGEELEFGKLSGGERELAFLVAQIVRFGLRDGLFLLDEPELHLNPSLLRNWLQYVAGTTSRCQLWIATHSWEAAEVVGPSGTIVLERDEEDRTVRKATLLESRPLIRVLSSAIGSPAFSLSTQRFVYVEGDGTGSERGRFAAMCGDPSRDRFIEGGGCSEVANKVQIVSELAGETDERLFVGGIIDRDFRTEEELASFQADPKLYVLPCHEVENLFLDHATIDLLARRNGDVDLDVLVLVTEVADRFAGIWLLRHAAAATAEHGKPSRKLRQAAGGTAWTSIEEQWTETRTEWLQADPDLPSEYAALLEQQLDAALEGYRAIRETESILTDCFGKEVFGSLAPSLGLGSVAALQRRILTAWRAEEVAEPPGVRAVREFIGNLAEA